MSISEKQKKEFFEMIQDIIETEEFCKSKVYKHHSRGNTYKHSIHVAYLCYKHQMRTGCDVNFRELIRGALLHDYFLYDWRKQEGCKFINGILHGFRHSKMALENALRDYPDLTRTEADIIKRHMFPLTIIPPSTKGGWLVCFYDKVAAIYEYAGLKNNIL